MGGNRRADRRREGRAPRSEYQRAIDPLRRATLELTDFTGAHRMIRPASGSAAALDLAVAEEWTGVLAGTGENVFQFANLSLIGAEESLRAMALIHGDRRAFVIADKVLARSALEACGRALHLLDLEADPAMRVNRALSERLHGIDENRQVEKVATQADDQSGKMQDLLRAAADQGLPVRPGANPPFVGSQRPGSNAALHLALDCMADPQFAAVAVRFLAWFAHTTPGGILSLSDTKNLRQGPDGQTSVPLIADASNVNLWLGFLGTVVALSQQAYLDYFGHFDPDWVQARREFSLAADAQMRA